MNASSPLQSPTFPTTDIVAVFPDGSVMWSMDELETFGSQPSGPSGSSQTPHPELPPRSGAGAVQYHYHYYLMNGGRWLLAAFAAGGAIAFVTAMILFFRFQSSELPDSTSTLQQLPLQEERYP